LIGLSGNIFIMNEENNIIHIKMNETGVQNFRIPKALDTKAEAIIEMNAPSKLDSIPLI
jgi:hypothetical protein